jgi:hypothetical protein
MKYTIDGFIVHVVNKATLPLSPECCTPEITQYPNVYHDGKGCRWGENDNSMLCQNLLLQVTTEGVVLNNGEPLAQECCTKTIVGGPVVWDTSLGSKTGRCIIPTKACENIQLAITIDGVVIDSSTGQSVPESCCTSEVVGNNVDWVLDGSVKAGQCKIRLDGGDTKGDTILGNIGETEATVRTTEPKEEYNLFDDTTPNKTTAPPNGDLPPQETDPLDSYYCWWCPPSEHLATVCSPEEFISTLQMSEEEFIIKAQGYGYKGLTYDGAVTFMTQVMSGFFKNNTCILMVPSTGEVLSNPQCCANRGGTWDARLRLCVVTQNLPCDPLSIQESYNNTNIVIDVSDKAPKVLDQNCCLNNGYYWGNLITVNNSDGSQTVLQDVATQQALFELGAKQGSNYCSFCPLDLFIGKDGSITDKDGNELNQKCCETYGYSYTEGVGCKSCPTNGMTNADTKEITDINGNPLSEVCCDAIGEYYGPGLMAGLKRDGCFACPQTYILNNELINGIAYTTVTDTSGKKLENHCCTYYGDRTGEKVAYSDTVGCYINNQLEEILQVK